jgi:hypothetical protein
MPNPDAPTEGMTQSATGYIPIRYSLFYILDSEGWIQ